MTENFKSIVLFCSLLVAYSCIKDYANRDKGSISDLNYSKKDGLEDQKIKKAEIEKEKNKNAIVSIFNKIAEEYYTVSKEAENIKNIKSNILKKIADDDQIGVILWDIDGDSQKQQVLKKISKISMDVLNYRFNFNSRLYPSGNLNLVPADVAGAIYGLCAESIPDWNVVHLLPKEQLAKKIRDHILTLTDEQISESKYLKNLESFK